MHVLATMLFLATFKEVPVQVCCCCGCFRIFSRL